MSSKQNNKSRVPDQIDIEITALVKRYGLGCVKDAVKRAQKVGAPTTRTDTRILFAWAQIEGFRLREKCSVLEACKKIREAGGLRFPTSITPGGIGDLVARAPRKFKEIEGTKIFNRIETLRSYHKRGEKILGILGQELSEEWQAYSRSLAKR